MIYFICKGYPELSGMRVERDLQNEKFLPILGIEPGPSANESKAYHWASKNDVSRVYKSSPGFNFAIFRNLPAAHVISSKIICRDLHTS